MPLVTHRFRHRTGEPISDLISEIGATGLAIELGSAGGAVVDLLVDDTHTADLAESMSARGWDLVEVGPTTFREREAQAQLGLPVSRLGEVPYASTLAGLVLGVPVVTGDGFSVTTGEGFGVVV